MVKFHIVNPGSKPKSYGWRDQVAMELNNNIRYASSPVSAFDVYSATNYRSLEIKRAYI